MLKRKILKRLELIDFYLSNIDDFIECYEDDTFYLYLYNKKKKLLYLLSLISNTH